MGDFENSDKLNSNKKTELHLGLGIGCGTNCKITEFLDVVVKGKLYVVGNTDYKPLLQTRSRYLSFSVGLKLSM